MKIVNMKIESLKTVKMKMAKNKTGKVWRKRAVMTVEASFLVPMAVMAAGIMISLCFHVYQRCWYTQAACETVIAGSTQGILKGDSGTGEAKGRWDILGKECYLVPQQFSASVGGGSDRIYINITGITPVWGRSGMNLNISESQNIIRPVKFIRKMSALKAIKEGTG